MRNLCLVSCVSIFCGVLFAKEYRNQIVSDPKPDTPEYVILKTIESCAGDDFEGWWSNWCHPDYCTDTEEAKAQMKKYSWQRCVKFAESYFADPTRKSFKVAYTKPANPKEDETTIRFFIISNKRDNPVPIVIRKHKGKWLVFNSSL